MFLSLPVPRSIAFTSDRPTPQPWHLIVILFLLLAGPLTAGAPLETLPKCVLVPTEWADGDSFLVRTMDGEEFTVRLYGADCLEWHITHATDERRLRAQRRYFGITYARAEPHASIALAKAYGEKAAQEVRQMLAKPFTIHTAFADARGAGGHKRVYAFVITSEGADLAERLISKGLARAFGVSRQTYDGRSQSEYRDTLADVELRAAKRGAGLWAETDWDRLLDERQEQRREDREIELAFDRQPLGEGVKLNPNTAAHDDLMKLPGIGEELANRIIENRPYSRSQDLLKVSGIGALTLQKIEPHLEL